MERAQPDDSAALFCCAVRGKGNSYEAGLKFFFSVCQQV